MGNHNFFLVCLYIVVQLQIKEEKRTMSATDKFHDLYKLEEVLGTGNFAVVRRCIEKETGQEFAVKCVEKNKLSIKDLVNSKRELEILAKLQHPNIVKLHRVFEDKEFCFIILELVTGGELFDRIIDKQYYTENEALTVVKVVANGLVYCHEQGITHRDLKPENLLYETTNENSNIKIADFGLAKIMNEESIMSTMCGTPGYYAPEVLANNPINVIYGV